jgi:hypothetical protein
LSEVPAQRRIALGEPLQDDRPALGQDARKDPPGLRVAFDNGGEIEEVAP